MSTFLDLMDGVAAYYGSGSDEWAAIAQGGVTAQTLPIIQQVPGVTVTRSASGAVLGYDYSNPFAQTPSGAAIIDSNAQSGSYGLTSYNANIPATAVTDAGTGVTTMQSGAVVSGTGRTLATVADRTSLALAGAALGTKLGLAIDTALYNANPQWWDEHFPSMNPSTWQTLVPDNAAGNVIRSLIGLDQTSNTATMYLDQRLLAYAYQTMLQNGAWGGGGEGSADYDGDTTFLHMEGIEMPFVMSTMASAKYGNTQYLFMSSSPTTCMILAPSSYSYPTRNQYEVLMIGASLNNDFTLSYQENTGTVTTLTPAQITVNGHTFWYKAFSRSFNTTQRPTVTGGTWNEWANVPWPSDTPPTQVSGNKSVAYIMLFGDITPGSVPGVEENPEASMHLDPSTVINPTTGVAVQPGDSLDDTINGLRTAYPNLFTNPVYEDVPQQDGTITRITYIPVPYPNVTPQGNPVTDLTPGVDPQVTPQVDPATRPDAGQGITDSVTNPPAPPETGSGETPPAIIPTGSASALYSVYNPSSSELASLGAWLWSTNFVDQLLKLFSDPMQAIIGLHKVFCIPPISGRGNIKVGYLDSGVTTNLVSGQYVTIGCGSVTLPEFYGNVLDYEPYTQVSIYLPFVGIVPLDTGEVMRGRLTVTYHIDVLTGACLAEVSVTRDMAGGILYTYTGNAAVQYPLSSGSYMGILSSLVSVAGGIVGTISSGGAMAPLAMGTAAGVLSARTRVQHSGGFSGNAGAMGVRRPYLIITRPQSALAVNYEAYQGAPANHTTTLGRCSGFVRVKAVHLDGIPATLQELTEIERMLREGIII